MKNKIILFGLLICLIAFIIVFGYTNAKYYSTASMTGDLDNIKTLGEISLYYPNWVSGYESGEGYFSISQIPTYYNNIHYQITNEVDGKINEEELEYYIRVVAENDGDEIPINYDVHKYNSPNEVYQQSEDENLGYGPFKLNAYKKEEQQYSLKVEYNSKDAIFLQGIQHLKVQMVRKRGDGAVQVISESPLDLKYTGNLTSAVLQYRTYGATPPDDLRKTNN